MVGGDVGGLGAGLNRVRDLDALLAVRDLGVTRFRAGRTADGRRKVFHKEADFEAFLAIFDEGQIRCPMRVLAFCLMPNHFHLVLWPRGDGDLSRWMQWVLTTHVRRYHEHYDTSGHVWQGRFKAFPIEQDEHLLTVMRYVERNPLRAGLCEAVDAWR